jgi:hypothetical protein
VRQCAWPLLAAVGFAAVAGCDPCAGTSSCRTSDRVSYTGHIVERATERSVAGTVVTFTRTSGVELLSNAMSAVSGADGFFQLAADAKSSGSVTGTLHVAPAGRPSYDETGITLRTTTVGGDGGDLGRIVIDPYITFIAVVRNRLVKSSAGLANATVTFVRTGGIQISPATISTSTDPNGLFLLAPAAAQGGTLEGVLTISAPGLPRSFQIPVRIDTRYQDVDPHDVTVVNVGAALLWVGEVHRRATNLVLPGIQVDFQRTGGIAIDPPQFTSTTNESGLVALQPTPLAEGELIGTVTIHPPGHAAPVVIPDVHIHTAADDSVRLAGLWGYGAQLFGALELRYRTTGLPVDSGAVVIFRRTAGVATQPDSQASKVNQFGFMGVQLPSDTIGDIVGDVEARLGEPYGTEVIRGLHLPSLEDDIQHFYGTKLIGRWFPQIAQLIDGDTQQPIPGARVTFTRVDGVPTSPDPYVTTPNPDGYFGIRPQPLADGDVVGNLTFELPPPYTTVTVRGIHLHSSMDDTLRFIGAFSFARPK